MIPYQVLYWTIGIFLLLSAPFAQCKKIHELMTDDEIMNSFQTTRDKVPDYEVVEIEHSLHKRSIPQDFIIKFKAFDEYVTSYLDPFNGFLVGENAPVWVSEKQDDGIHYRQLRQGIMKEVLGFYQNVSNQDAVVVRSRNGRDLQFRGTVQDLTITPLPDRIQRELDKPKRRKKRSGNLMPVYRSHFAFRPTSDVLGNYLDQKNRDTELLRKICRFNTTFEDTVYPTILVTTDFNLNVEPGNDNAYYDQILYQMAFWNGVDLRFRHMDIPRIRLRIAGLIIGSNRDATPYLKEFRIPWTETYTIDLNRSINEMEDYWSQTKRHPMFSPESFHIVATITNRGIVRNDGDRPVEMLGRSNAGSICGETENRFYPSMIVQDDQGFHGVHSAAHQLARILGATGDNETTCPEAHGPLMGTFASYTFDYIERSDCGSSAIERTLSTHNCTKKPREHFPPGEPLDRVVPGALMTADEQCRARGFDVSCMSPLTCGALQCFSGGNTVRYSECKILSGAAEGTICEPDKYCIAGQCQLL